MASDKRIDNEHAGHAQNGNADRAAAALSQRKNADDTEDDLDLIDHRSLADDLIVVDNIIEIRNASGDRQNNIVPRHMVGLHISLLCGEDEEGEQNDHADEQAAADLTAPSCPDVHPNHEEHKRRQREAQDLLGHTRPDTHIRLSVVFFHNFVDIGSRADIGFYFGGDRLVDVLFDIRHIRIPPLNLKSNRRVSSPKSENARS